MLCLQHSLSRHTDIQLLNCKNKYAEELLKLATTDLHVCPFLPLPPSDREGANSQ